MTSRSDSATINPSTATSAIAFTRASSSLDTKNTVAGDGKRQIGTIDKELPKDSKMVPIYGVPIPG